MHGGMIVISRTSLSISKISCAASPDSSMSAPTGETEDFPSTSLASMVVIVIPGLRLKFGRSSRKCLRKSCSPQQGNAAGVIQVRGKIQYSWLPIRGCASRHQPQLRYLRGGRALHRANGIDCGLLRMESFSLLCSCTCFLPALLEKAWHLRFKSGLFAFR
jgi:hypothetical protein